MDTTTGTCALSPVSTRYFAAGDAFRSSTPFLTISIVEVELLAPTTFFALMRKSIVEILTPLQKRIRRVSREATGG